MPYTNSFFSNTTGYSPEVQLLDDLTREQIKMFGIDIAFMPRILLNLDTLLNESPKSAFTMALPMPMYIKSFDGYDNGMELLTKFGVRSADQITLQMSRSEFGASYAPFIKGLYENQNGGADLDPLKGQTADRPKEGDLIYFPFDDAIFEVKLVVFDVPFFQFGHGYVYELQCEKFEYSGETFSTGYADVDDTVLDTSYYMPEFTMAEGGDGSFRQFEEVIIYNVAGLETPLESDAVPFSFYNDSGFLEGVQSVKAKVASWNIRERRLVVSDIVQTDPYKQDEDYNLDVSNLKDVLIVGQTTDASWLSESVETKEVPFNQAKEIQTEFDDIKVVDVGDTNPFGFF